MTGAGPETFELISEAHINSYRRYAGLDSRTNVCEIGCGIGRDAIPLAEILDKEASYFGIDIIDESIEWCSKNITRRHTNFRFIHFDVKDQLHNPNGTIETTEISLPIKNQTIDLVILQSVFTHMFKPGIIHYMKEFRRILNPNGRVYATFFIVDDAILQRARETNLTPYNLRFEHNIGGGCYINDRVHPLGAVAYTETAVADMVERGGLRIVRRLYGAWSGYFQNPDDAQDALVLAVES